MTILPFQGCSKTAIDETPSLQTGNQLLHNPTDDRRSENGIAEIRHTFADGRIVYMYVPDSVHKNPTVKVPLVLVLHATASTPRSVVYSRGWIDKAVKENFIVIAPA